MGVRKNLKKTMERVDKIAKVINSTQGNILYSNGFILGAMYGGSEPSAYIKSVNLDTTNQIVFTKKDNTQQTFTVSFSNVTLSDTTSAENMTISGDLTLDKGAHFTADADAELTVDCESTFNHDFFWIGKDSASTPTRHGFYLLGEDDTDSVMDIYYETAKNDWTLTFYKLIDFTEASVYDSNDYGKYLHSNASTGKLEWTTVSGGEPSAYLKSASVSSNTLTLTNKDDSVVTFTPSTGTTVEANPTLAGTESELQGLKVGTTSYKVDRVSVSDTGTSTTTLPSYITINGTEYNMTKNISVNSTGTSTTDIPDYVIINGTEYHRKHLYKHEIYMKKSGGTGADIISLNIYNNSSTLFDFASLVSWLTSNGYTSFRKCYLGWRFKSDLTNGCGIYYTDSAIYSIVGDITTNFTSTTATTFTDTITQLL